MKFFSIGNLSTLACLLVGVFALRWSIVAPYHVPTASMLPGIVPGDRILANKMAYRLRLPFSDVTLWDLASVRRGEIIVFRNPRNPHKVFVKRVVGISGDEIFLLGDQVFINGRGVLREKVVNLSSDSHFADLSPGEVYHEQVGTTQFWSLSPSNLRSQQRWPETGVYRVPPASVFVLGDNRELSQDSREWGSVPMAYVEGKAFLVFWSAEKAEGARLPWPRLSRFIQKLY